MPKPVQKGKNPELSVYYDARLAQVVTLSEASYLWDKSITTLMQHVYKNRLSGRLSITGGTWLISTASLLKLYGRPHNSELHDYYIEENSDNENLSISDTALWQG